MSIPTSGLAALEPVAAPVTPLVWLSLPARQRTSRQQRLRRLAQILFFSLFVLAPVFDLLRYDLTRGHAYVLGFEWHLGLDDYFAKRISAREVGWNIFLRLFLPAFGASFMLVAIAWRWGRIFCGWACPHFAVVEMINPLMARTTGKLSLWDRKALPRLAPSRLWWWPTAFAVVVLSCIWAVALLTYALPPAEVYPRLLEFSLAPIPALFVAMVTLILSLEFLFARHLFCRYGCSLGLFQSLAWMMNRNALVVGFERVRASACAACYAPDGPGDAACEIACPMRLRPRVTKQQMFSCTQCGHCIDACPTVQPKSLLRWVQGKAAQCNEARSALMDRVF